MGEKIVIRKDGSKALIGTGKDSGLHGSLPSRITPTNPRHSPNHPVFHKKTSGVVEAGDHSVEHASQLFSNFKESETNRKIKLSLSLNTTYPFPQANSLAKVASVVDAVSEGADSDDALGAGVGVVLRQGSYYAVAAAYLGLIEEVGVSPRAWGLTAQGAVFLESNAEERIDILLSLVEKIDASDAALDDDDSAEDEISRMENLSSSTAGRRAACLKSWIDTLTNKSEAITALTLEQDGVRVRLPEATVLALSARAKRLGKNVEKPLAICNQCFLALLPSGLCGECG
jgi:hypothetical protein